MAGRGTPQGDVENVQQGMDELMELAAAEGPPDVPENIGNVPPARATRPQRQPERLPTADEEMLERQVNGLPVGKQRTRDDDGERDDDRLEREERPRRTRREEQAEDDADGRDQAEDVTDDVEAGDDEEQEPDVVDEIEGRGRRALPRWAEAELARRDQEMARLQGQVQALLAGRAPTAAAPAPEQSAAPEPITLENAVPFELGEDFIEQIRAGDPKQAATLMRAALGVTAYRLAERLAQQYAHLQAQQPRPEAVIAQHAEVAREKAALERAFYGSHRDIDPERHGELVQIVSAQLRPRLVAEGRFNNKAWLDETAREVRRIAGIQRRASGGRRSVTRSLEDGGDERRGNVRPIRPAYSETSTATGRVHGKKPLTPLQKEMLDLARFAG